MNAGTTVPDQAQTEDETLSNSDSLPGFAAFPVLLVAAAKVVGTMAVAGSYGFQRDELYYLACARHLAWGYVDFPAVVPALARLNVFLFGTGVATLRLFSVLAGAAVILLAALITRELGGGSRAQVLAAFAVLFSPLFLGANILFQTVSFDQLTWSAAIFVVARLLRTGDGRLWPVLGGVFGLGLETKYTILALAAGLLAGFLLSRERQQLATRGPYLAAGIALLILLPNLVWQIQHGWPSLTYVLQHSGDTGSRPQFVAQTLLLLGPIGLPLAVLGVFELFSMARMRPLAWAAVLTPLLLLAVNGKSYYAGPIYPLLLAAGSIRALHLVARRRLLFAIVLTVLTASTAALVPLALPVYPLHRAVSDGIVSARTDFADMLGWPGIAAATAHAYDRLPPIQRRQATIVASNYGEAGAVDLYGSRYRLPHAVSGDLTYALWKPAHVPEKVVIAVGFPRNFMQRYFRSVAPAGTIGMPYHVHNQEYGQPILICRGPRTSFDVFFAHIHGWA
jgi:hypothetical protein